MRIANHGVSEYRNWGCRCDICKKAKSEQMARYDKEPQRKASRSIRDKKYRKTPEVYARIRARNYLCQLVSRGKITRLPCSVCGETKVEAHHEDYSKPKDVVWLCRKHHRDRHPKFRRVKTHA